MKCQHLVEPSKITGEFNFFGPKSNECSDLKHKAPRHWLFRIFYCYTYSPVYFIYRMFILFYLIWKQTLWKFSFATGVAKTLLSFFHCRKQTLWSYSLQGCPRLGFFFFFFHFRKQTLWSYSLQGWPRLSWTLTGSPSARLRGLLTPCARRVIGLNWKAHNLRREKVLHRDLIE